MFLLYLFIVLCAHAAHAQAPLKNVMPIQKNVMHHDAAKNVLDSGLYQSPAPSIITTHEWKEFQLDRLITILDRTKTSFGRWGLAELLQPIADADELAQRKDIITFLIEHEAELSLLQEQLDKIHVAEKSLLVYWDKGDLVNKGAQQFYYSLEGLNNSSLALNSSVATQMVSAWASLLFSLGLGGITKEFDRWAMTDQVDGKKTEGFDWVKGIKEGFRGPLKQHSWNLELFKTKDKSYKYTHQDYGQAMLWGSWGDRYKILSEGFATDIVFPEKFPLSLAAIISRLYTFPKAEGAVGKTFAVINATLPTVAYDYYWATSLWSVGSYIISMNKTLNQLHDRVVDVATVFNAIKSINQVIRKYPEIAYNHYTSIEYNDRAKECLKKLAAPRFAHKGSYFYSRGHVLSMHKEIKQARRSLIPLLQSVAFLDAYCSIAQLYKESQDKAVKFSFPEFIPSSKPLLFYDNAWLPLLSYQQAVTNNLCLGDNCPGKIIITGPNGGGKSTLLKTYGVAAILAQSWMIIPATHGSQTLFAAIQTGLAPHEDLEQGLSTFMAEKKRMVELFEAMQKSDARQRNILVLIDEPYKGTVDDESAKRIYQFGKDVAGFSHVLLAIATHVKKPIELAVDTQNIFGNYQVKIDELSHGVFERLFKIEEGPATWWFENADQRSRFIDWISYQTSGF